MSEKRGFGGLEFEGEDVGFEHGKLKLDGFS